jgi:hypothetical protein
VIRAIPTHYNDVRFRSRLEAKWAVFFDLCGWRWQYEPFDMPGWIPDFILRGENNVLVEVKPYSGASLETWNGVISKCHAAWSKCQMECDADSLLLLGDSPYVLDEHYNQYAIGQLSETAYHHADIMDASSDMVFARTPDELWFADAVIGECWVNHKIDFCHKDGSFHCRMFGGYPGGSYPCANGEVIRKLWSKACNTVQWNASR